MNIVMLHGRLREDPTLRATQNGKQVLSFRMATEERWVDRDGGAKRIEDWHSVVMWGAQAEAVHRDLSKGCSVIVEGKLKSRSYDAKDGTKKYVVEVNASRIEVVAAAVEEKEPWDNSGLPDDRQEKLPEGWG